MEPHHSDIGRIVRAGGGVIARRDHPQLIPALNWLVRRVSFWPTVAMTDITVAVEKGRRGRARGFDVSKRPIPPDLFETRRSLRYRLPR